MGRHQRRFDDADFDLGEPSRLSGLGTVMVAAAIGVGIGMLAAPDAGLKTRRRLRRRLASLGEDLGEGFGEIQERGGRARAQVRSRLERARQRGEEAWEGLGDRFRHEEEEEDEDSSAFGTALAIAAGVAATYFLTSERAAPARTRVRETADTVRKEATDRWQRYQTRRRESDNGQTRAGETLSDSVSSDDAPQAS